MHCSSELRLAIVHVTSYQVPDYGYEELALAKEQQRLGHNVTILTSNYLHPLGSYSVLSHRFPIRQVRPVTEEHAGVRVVRLRALEGIGHRVWIHGLERELHRLQPDIVHCHNLLQFHSARLVVLKARRQLRAGLVIDDHMHQSVVRRSLLGKLFYWCYRRLHPLLGTQVGSFCAISDGTRQYLAEECGVQGNIELRPLGVDARLFVHAESARYNWRRRLELDADALVFLYTGKVIAAKGVDVLVSAALRLVPRYPSLRVIIVGDSDDGYLRHLRIRVGAAGLEDRFRFLPSQNQEDLAALYSAADVAVWPRQESRSLYEALSCSLPVIVSSSSSYGGLVDNVLGRVYGPDDHDLVRAMLELTPVAVRSECGRRARKLVRGEYSWERCAERYLDTYRRVLDNDRRRTGVVAAAADKVVSA